MNFALNTLGCPDWSFDQVIENAVENGFKHLEIRGILGKMKASEIPEFSEEGYKALSEKLIYNLEFFSKLLTHYRHHFTDKLFKVSLCLFHIINLICQEFITLFYLFILFDSINVYITESTD